MQETQTFSLGKQVPAKTIINVADLAKMEQNIIACMFLSEEIFAKIAQKVAIENFTFVQHKKIYHLITLLHTDKKHLFFSNIEKTQKEMNSILNSHFKIPTLIAISAFAVPVPETLEADICEVLHYYDCRLKACDNYFVDGMRLYINFEDQYGKTLAHYKNNRLQKVETSNILNTPPEMHDTFTESFESIMTYTKKANNLVTMEDPQENQRSDFTIFFDKNIRETKHMTKLESWAMLHGVLPAKKEEFSITTFFVGNNAGIESLPKEVFMLKQLKVLDVMDNAIKHLPKHIAKLEKLLVLNLCNNNLSALPKELYELSSLETLCLHGNKLEKLDEEIGKLVNLEVLKISNNDITLLPHSIGSLKKLRCIDIENTLICEEDLDFIPFSNISSISFDERLFPYFLKNNDRLKNFDTINLAHSTYTQDDAIIKGLNLEVVIEKWIEEGDSKGKGCILLLNSADEDFESDL